MDSNEARLREVFREVLRLPSDAVVTDVSPATVAAWDSLAHALLVSAIESEFAIQVDPAESLDLTSFDAATRLLHERGL